MFYRTHTYTVHVKDDVTNIDGVEFVPEGFNLWAFLFGAFWAFYQRLWIAGGVIVALQAVAIHFVQSGLFSEGGSSMIQVLLSLALGLFGNDLIRRRLERRGFIFTDVVIAENETKATQRFLDRVVSA